MPIPHPISELNWFLGSLADVGIASLSLVCWLYNAGSVGYRFTYSNIWSYHEMAIDLVLGRRFDKDYDGQPVIYVRKTNKIWYDLFQMMHGTEKGYLKYDSKKPKKKVPFMITPGKVCGICGGKLKWLRYIMMVSTVWGEKSGLLVEKICSNECLILAELKNV